MIRPNREPPRCRPSRAAVLRSQSRAWGRCPSRVDGGKLASRVNESDPQKDVLDYATPKARGGGPSSAGEGRARMIGAAVMFAGAGILMGNREDVLVTIGLALGLLALVAFALEYRRSWHRDDG